MKYIKYFLAYASLTIVVSVIIFEFLVFFNYLDIKLTFGNREFLTYFISIPCILIYDKYKPFKLTGNLDLYIKKKWNNYLESQKTCPNCEKVVSKEELTSNGKCKYCDDVDVKDLEKYPNKKEK